MVHIAEVRGYQLRHGSRRLGCALGAVLAGTSLLMKEWGSDPDEKPDRKLRLEVAVLSVGVLAAYLIVVYHLATSFFEQ